MCQDIIYCTSNNQYGLVVTVSACSKCKNCQFETKVVLLFHQDAMVRIFQNEPINFSLVWKGAVQIEFCIISFEDIGQIVAPHQNSFLTPEAHTRILPSQFEGEVLLPLHMCSLSRVWKQKKDEERTRIMGANHRLKYYILYSPIGELEKVLVMSENLHSIKERTFVVQHVCIYEVWEAV